MNSSIKRLGCAYVQSRHTAIDISVTIVDSFFDLARPKNAIQTPQTRPIFYSSVDRGNSCFEYISELRHVDCFHVH
jgi:hypothetical protein